jgi:hypothetical protein
MESQDVNPQLADTDQLVNDPEPQVGANGWPIVDTGSQEGEVEGEVMTPEQEMAYRQMVNVGIINFTQEMQRQKQILLQMLPQSRGLAMVFTKIDEAALWASSLLDDEAGIPEEMMQSPPEAPEAPDLWVPEGAGQVDVPVLHVVGEDGSSEPLASETEGGTSE